MRCFDEQGSQLPKPPLESGGVKTDQTDWLGRAFWAGAVLVASWLPTLLYLNDLRGRSPQNASFDVIIVYPLLFMLHVTALSLAFGIVVAKAWNVLTAAFGSMVVAVWILLLMLTWSVVSQVL